MLRYVNAIDAVVACHETERLAFSDADLESLQVDLAKRPLRQLGYDNVEKWRVDQTDNERTN